MPSWTGVCKMPWRFVIMDMQRKRELPPVCQRVPVCGSRIPCLLLRKCCRSCHLSVLEVFFRRSKVVITCVFQLVV